MKRKFFSCFMLAALMGAGMISVTSCADYAEDINVLQTQVDNNMKVHEALQAQVNGMEAQIKALQEALNAMKSCTCGDVDQKISDAINKALAGLNYSTPDQVADAISKALESINTGLTADEVQALINAYHASNPGCECGDIQTLIENYLKNNPGLTEADVEAIVKAYHDAHPSSSLTENDVKSIVETYINQLQHFTKDQIEGMINTAIAQALANYTTCNCDTYTKAQIDALIETAIKNYAATDAHGLTTEEVIKLINDAIAKIQHPESGLSKDQVDEIVTKAIADALKDVTKGLATEEYVKKLVEEAKCECPALTSDEVSAIASSVIEQYMKDHPYTLDTEAVKSIVNTTIDNSTIINGITSSISTLQNAVGEVKTALESVYTKDEVYNKGEVESLINTLIQQAIKECNCDNTVLSPEQQAIVSQLIAQAIENYSNAHPDCNCQYDAAAFQQLVNDVAANTQAIAGIVIPDVSNFITNDDLSKAINEVKALIPAAADLSNYVTIAALNEALSTVNSAIQAAESKASTALETANSALGAANQASEKAAANEIAINNLQTTVNNLNSQYQILSSKLSEAAKKAEDAYSKASTNAQEIKTLKGTYQELLKKIEELEAKGYDDTELRGRIEALEALKDDIKEINEKLEKYITSDDLKDFVTKGTLDNYVSNEALTEALKSYVTRSELGNYVTTEQLNGYVSTEALTAELDKVRKDAKSYAEEAAKKAAAEKLEEAKSYTNTKIGELDSAYKKADTELQNQINTINTTLTSIQGRLDTLEQDMSTVKGDINKINDALAKLITGIELQGSTNPAFGYFALPVGITSNVLIAYYGENDEAIDFPTIDDGSSLVYKDEENWITEEDAARIGMTQGNTGHWNGKNGYLVGGTGNAGKLYLTVNPSSVDFTGTTLKLVNSIGEESPVELGALKPSKDKLTFGQTRATATNGFYEATATVKKNKVNNVSYGITDQLVEILKDIKDNGTNANISNIAQAVYNQFNGVLDAYAVQATWTDALGEHTVTSNYNIAATAIKPLSYNTLFGIGFSLPTITPLSERNLDLKKYIDLSQFTKEFKKESLGINIKFDFSDIYVDKEGNVVTDVVLIDKNKDYQVSNTPVILISASGVYTDPVTGATKTFTSYDRETAEWVAQIITNRADTWSAQLTKEFADNIEKLVDKVNSLTAPGGQLENKLNELVDQVQDKLNSVLKTGDKFIKQLNHLIGEVNDNLFGNGNPNLRLQGHVFYSDAQGFLHPMSTAKGFPTTFTGDGEAIELNLSSYTGEILAPAYKKFIAVTNVYKDGKDADSSAELMGALQAANAVKDFNQIINGDRYSVAFHPTVKDATYEIVYSSLDYHGFTSQRKYYVHVK